MRNFSGFRIIAKSGTQRRQGGGGARRGGRPGRGTGGDGNAGGAEPPAGVGGGRLEGGGGEQGAAPGEPAGEAVASQGDVDPPEDQRHQAGGEAGRLAPEEG